MSRRNWFYCRGALRILARIALATLVLEHLGCRVFLIGFSKRLELPESSEPISSPTAAARSSEPDASLEALGSDCPHFVGSAGCSDRADAASCARRGAAPGAAGVTRVDALVALDAKGSDAERDLRAQVYMELCRAAEPAFPVHTTAAAIEALQARICIATELSSAP